MQKIGLCLGGGGARGLCHIEFLKVLDEMDIKPQIISGTSIGAIIGSFYAAGLSGNEIHEILDSLDLTKKKNEEVEEKEDKKEEGKLEKFLDSKLADLKEYYRKFDSVHKLIDISLFKTSSFLDGKGVAKFFEDNLPVKKFEDLKIPLKIVATDYWRQQQVVFDSGELVPAIRASMSIPAVFAPVVIDDTVLVDGGIANNLPYDLIQDECDLTIAIDVSGTIKVPQKPKLPSFFDSIMVSFNTLQNSVIHYQMKIKEPDIYIKPELLDVNILEFHKVKEIMESVENDVQNFRKNLKKLI
ncbi:MAG: patatin-like phospholipase family protein [Candidatus Cloacimonetes bacterium]|nr:patatin-like phospholipase family protein [Candidatus Cloacimonadota bacterium]MCF7814491.1 patatin-like phospholipase family protein [Candidatus Cloacimonadota bacterium]MCF7867883.1 patatin-like phospholipase family protein [Candidatus Cloacimonadota bacterium]MCF7883702.1 patatin-like phospholipase family protein [Candidatus Cloacimonadota bacterium]